MALKEEKKLEGEVTMGTNWEALKPPGTDTLLVQFSLAFYGITVPLQKYHYSLFLSAGKALEGVEKMRLRSQIPPPRSQTCLGRKGNG